MGARGDRTMQMFPLPNQSHESRQGNNNKVNLDCLNNRQSDNAGKHDDQKHPVYPGSYRGRNKTNDEGCKQAFKQ